MKIYLVGGAVRDKLLGLPVKERDWVVVGATAENMLALGYRQVGKEFPVFLHPKTHEEYALARMERKVDAGYKGFTFDTSTTVGLEDDLLRRDLTINAMAESADGELIDPYHGKEDLTNRILRHVSPAFAEDPVRILRIGRFLARYAHLGFTVAADTLQLMKDMVKAGEVDALVAERVWKEFERALSEPQPTQFFNVLAQCDAMAILFPQLTTQKNGMAALQTAANMTTSTVVRFAVLLHDLPDAKNTIAALCNRYRTPNEFRELATITALHHETAFQWSTLNASELLKLFYTLDIYRREKRFHDFLTACSAIAATKQLEFDLHALHACAHAAKSYPVQHLIEQGFTGTELVAKIQSGRQAVIEKWLNEH